MNKQPEALRLAAVAICDRSIGWQADATAELHRLSAENETLKAQRDALLEAVQGIVDFVDGPAEAKRPDVFFLRISKARAAIAKAEAA